ncbi:MAG: extracellular solute-binding protein [Anaerolineae bacterium]
MSSGGKFGERTVTRRGLLIGMGALAGVGALAACGGTATPAATAVPEATSAATVAATTAPPPATGEEVHIVWLTRTSPNENKWEMEVAKPEFEAMQSTIKVDILNINQDDIRLKYQAMIAAKEPLDVWSVNWGAGGFGVNHFKLGLLEELTPFIERDQKDLSDYHPFVINLYKIDGKQWAIPFNMRGSYLYYNKKIFDDAGITYPPTSWDDTSWQWDNMLEIAKQTTHDYDDVAKAQYGIVITQTMSNPEAMGLMFQVNCWPEEFYTTGTAPEVDLTNPTIVQAFEAQHDMIFGLKVHPTRGLEQALGELGGTFPSGKVAMLTTGGWGHQQYAGLEKEKFCWGVAPFPWYDTNNKGPRCMLYPNPWNITKGTPRKEEAWQFVAYLTSIKGETSFMKSVNACPPIKSLIKEYVAQFPCMTAEEMNDVFLGAFDYGRDASDHFALEWADVFKVWTNTMDNYWLEPDAKAIDYLSRAKEEIDKVLQAG